MIKGTVVQTSRDGRQMFVKLVSPLEIVPICRRYSEDPDPVVVDVVCASREKVDRQNVAVFPAMKRGVGKRAGYVIRSWSEIGYGIDHKSALADCGVEI